MEQGDIPGTKCRGNEHREHPRFSFNLRIFTV